MSEEDILNAAYKPLPENAGEELRKELDTDRDGFEAIEEAIQNGWLS